MPRAEHFVLVRFIFVCRTSRIRCMKMLRKIVDQFLCIFKHFSLPQLFLSVRLSFATIITPLKKISIQFTGKARKMRTNVLTSLSTEADKLQVKQHEKYWIFTWTCATSNNIEWMSFYLVINRIFSYFFLWSNFPCHCA